MIDPRIRRLVIVVGDQLDSSAALPADVGTEQDSVWMCKSAEEATHVPSHNAPTALFLIAMRHFRYGLEARGIPVRYHELDHARGDSLASTLIGDLTDLRPLRVALTRPGEWRVAASLRDACAETGTALDEREDDHFFCSTDAFRAWAKGRKTLRLKRFYRHMRKREGVLMAGAEPAGGRWNIDAENRRGLGRVGPGRVSDPVGFEPDPMTRGVLETVERHFPTAPGSLARFDWPVTRAQALTALADFTENRLPAFGTWQDAMSSGQPWLWHARISPALNLKLLNPREVIAAATDAYGSGHAPLASTEGFVRQVLGWREYVRGLYWLHMPDYTESNTLGADRPLPVSYWNAQTDLACLREVVGQVLEHGCVHHIQCLMVTGLFGLLLGVEPRQLQAWYVAIFVDAVEWAEAPNTIGMSQFADGGLLASKPYAASGGHINRMSDYCRECRFDPKDATGDTACPYTTLFRDRLVRHEARFHGHPRIGVLSRNLARLEPERLDAIPFRAEALCNAPSDRGA